MCCAPSRTRCSRALGSPSIRFVSVCLCLFVCMYVYICANVCLRAYVHFVMIILRVYTGSVSIITHLARTPSHLGMTNKYHHHISARTTLAADTAIARFAVRIRSRKCASRSIRAADAAQRPQIQPRREIRGGACLFGLCPQICLDLFGLILVHACLHCSMSSISESD